MCNRGWTAQITPNYHTYLQLHATMLIGAFAVAVLQGLRAKEQKQAGPALRQRFRSQQRSEGRQTGRLLVCDLATLQLLQ
jgi:hypothetical protein